MQTAIERELEGYKRLLEMYEGDVKNRTEHLEAVTGDEAKSLYGAALKEATERRDKCKALVEKQQAAVDQMLAKAALVAPPKTLPIDQPGS